MSARFKVSLFVRICIRGLKHIPVAKVAVTTLKIVYFKQHVWRTGSVMRTALPHDLTVPYIVAVETLKTVVIFIGN